MSDCAHDEGVQAESWEHEIKWGSGRDVVRGMGVSSTSTLSRQTMLMFPLQSNPIDGNVPLLYYNHPGIFTSSVDFLQLLTSSHWPLDLFAAG